MRWALLLCIPLLAGCADGGGPDQPCDSLAQGEPCLDDLPTQDTGVLRGVIVDAAIQPLTGVDVTATRPGQSHNTTTDDEGRFVLAGLDPGTYTLHAQKLGHEPGQVQATVEAGTVSDIIKMQLTRIPGFAPFYEQFPWEGYIQCNTTNANVCLIINYYPDSVAGTGPITNDASSHLFYEEFVDTGDVPDLIQVETVWESTQPLGASLSIRYQADRPDTILIDCPYGSGGTRESVSPQTFRINATKAAEMGIGKPLDEDPDADDNCDPTEANGLGVEFFSGDALGACQDLPLVGCVPRAGATLEQRVTMYVTAFYDYLPPEDWTFVETGMVPAPDA